MQGIVGIAHVAACSVLDASVSGAVVPSSRRWTLFAARTLGRSRCRCGGCVAVVWSLWSVAATVHDADVRYSVLLAAGCCCAAGA